MANPVTPNLDGSNPGPAGISTLNTQLMITPKNMPDAGSGVGAGTNALRLIAVARSVGILTTGDIAVIPLINTQSFFVTNVYFTNSVLNGASASAAALTVSLNGGPGVTGTSIVASAALTTQTSQSVRTSSTVAPTTVLYTATIGNGATFSNFLYLNATVASAAAATIDLFVYGYDFT